MQDHGPGNVIDHLSPRGWDDALAATGPAMLLLVVEQRMGAALLRQTAPEDILQDALLHAWRDRTSHRWQNPRTFRNWILSIIDHRIQDARDYHSALKRGGGVRPQSLSPATPSDGTGGAWGEGDAHIPVSTTPSRIAWYRDQASAVRAAIDSLPDDVRAVVRLRLVEQLQVSEIATHTGIGESAVRHRFRRGAEMFRYRLTSLLGTRAESGHLPKSGTVDGQASSP